MDPLTAVAAIGAAIVGIGSAIGISSGGEEPSRCPGCNHTEDDCVCDSPQD